jgi:hypothetical protein
MVMNEEKSKYFATFAPNELSDELVRKSDQYFEHMEKTGLLRKLQKSYDRYYGNSSSGNYGSSSDVSYGGEQGELSMVRVNHYRNLIQHLLVMTTGNRPALECRSINTDVKSMSQTILGSGILDYYMRDKRLERFLKIACLNSILYGEGYVHLKWDQSLGEAYGVNQETQEVIHEGDIAFATPMGPLDVIKDINLNDYADTLWLIVVERKNKYDLAAKYPEKAEEIEKVGENKDRYTRYDQLLPNLLENNEQIPVYHFYHKPSAALPEGREFIYLESGLWLFDGPLSYKKLPGGLPIFRIAPDNFFGTPFGYSQAWDLIGLCEVTDALYSTIVSNQLTFGVQNIIVPKGHDITYQQLAGGMNLIEYDPQLGAPEALNLTKTPQELFQFIKDLKEELETLSGVNSVQRGNPEASLKSGAALALVASQAVQFNSGLQGEYNAILEDVGMAVIKMLQSFSHTQRAASIAGKSKQYMIKSFSGTDLESINRVIVDVSSPISKTIAGRLEIARDMLQIPGVIRNPEQYLQVVNTGKIEPLIEGKEMELLNVKAENELLQEGQPVQAIITERHDAHIDSHSSILSNPEAKKNPQVLQATLTHINEHIQLLMTGNPILLQMRGQQSLAPMMGPPEGPESSASEVTATGEQSAMAPQQPKMPSMPKNPQTGQKYDPNEGV